MKLLGEHSQKWGCRSGDRDFGSAAMLAGNRNWG